MLDNEMEPKTAPGDDDFLELDATTEEKAEGNYTRLTRLSFEEVGPS